MNAPPEERLTIREICAKLAAIEAQYWGQVEDDRMQLIALGAMGAAANICCAILTECTPEQYREACKTRGKQETA